MSESSPVDRTVATAILLTNAAATLFMTGLIWCIQVVHYPLFAAVGADAFTAYAAGHSGLITPVVAPPMLIELATAGLLLRFRPPVIRAGEAAVGLILVAVIWWSTLFLQVPQHNILASGFDAAVHQWLVDSNWVRTTAWSLRAGLVLGMVARLMR